jgi:hypothetical protein
MTLLLSTKEPLANDTLRIRSRPMTDYTLPKKKLCCTQRTFQNADVIDVGEMRAIKSE